MPDSKITDLTSLVTPSDNDVFPIVDVLNDTTKKITVSTLGSFFNTAVNSNSGNWNSVYTNVNSNSGNYILDGGNTKGGAITAGTKNTQQFGLITNNVTRIEIGSSGNISFRGLNGALPVSNVGLLNMKFTNGTPFGIRIERSDNANVLFGVQQTNGRVINTYGAQMSISEDTNERIRLHSSGPSWSFYELGIGLTTPTRQLHVRATSVYSSSPTITEALSSPFPVLRIDNAMVGTPSNGIGTRIEFGTKVLSASNIFVGNTIDSVATNVASGTESFDFSFRNSNAGTAHAERLRIKSTGAIKFTSVGADPSSPETGDVYFNSIVNRLRFYDASNARWNNVNSTRTIETFIATENQPVSANFATLDTRNIDNIAVLNFPPLAPNREARFVGIIPEGTIMNDGLLVKIRFSTRTATTSSCRWGAQIKKVSSLSYATSASVDVPITGTAGLSLMNGDIILTSTDSLTEGDAYALRILRESSNAADTMADTAQLVSVEVRAIN
jgi:hypothetical protein